MGVMPRRFQTPGKLDGWSRSSCVGHFLSFPKHIWQHEDKVLQRNRSDVASTSGHLVFSAQGSQIWFLIQMSSCSHTHTLSSGHDAFSYFHCQYNQPINEKNLWWANGQFVPPQSLECFGVMTAANSALWSLSLIEACVFPTCTLLPGNCQSGWK